MRKSAKKIEKKLVYPQETEGSRIAATVRKQASMLFKQAMLRIRAE
jgi:hypothetical protein